MHGDPGPEKGKEGPNLLQSPSSSSPLCLLLPPAHISWKVAVPGLRPVGETEARLSRPNARAGAHRVPPDAWERRKPGRRRRGAGRKSETIGKLSFTPCKWLGCPRPFLLNRGNWTPSCEPEGDFAPGSREWCRDEAPPHPHSTAGSFPSSHGRGGRSTVLSFSFLFPILGPGHTSHQTLPWGQSILSHLLVCLGLPGNCETEWSWGGGRKPLKNKNKPARAVPPSPPSPLKTVASGVCRDR